MHHCHALIRHLGQTKLSIDSHFERLGVELASVTAYKERLTVIRLTPSTTMLDPS
jgi:hypothetical protein